MSNELDAYINTTILKDRKILVDIFKNIEGKHKGESLRQHAIRAAIMQFEQLYPDVLSEFDTHTKKKRELAKNEHSADYDSDIRLAFAIPDGLETRISLLLQKLHDEIRFLSDEAEKEFKEQEWFKKSFPRYVIPSKF